MRRSTTAAVTLITLVGLFGCASTDDTAAAPGGAPATPSLTPGLDDGTRTTCILAHQATLGENGKDLDIATGKDIVAAGKTSQSSLITSAVNVLESVVLRAEAAAGTEDEPTVTAEVSPAILKVQTVCQDTDSLKSSIQSPGAGGGDQVGAKPARTATATSRA